MGQKSNESAKDFIVRIRDHYKSRDGDTIFDDLPRTMMDPAKVTFVVENPKPKPSK